MAAKSVAVKAASRSDTMCARSLTCVVVWTLARWCDGMPADMYHNPDDVIGGVLIGFAYAVAAFYWSMVPRDGTVLQDGTERVVNPLGGAVPPV